MSTPDKKTQKVIVNEMVNIHRERGAQTTDDLIRAGYSTEQISTCGPIAAQRIAELERADA